MNGLYKHRFLYLILGVILILIICFSVWYIFFKTKPKTFSEAVRDLKVGSTVELQKTPAFQSLKVETSNEARAKVLQLLAK